MPSFCTPHTCSDALGLHFLHPLFELLLWILVPYPFLDFFVLMLTSMMHVKYHLYVFPHFSKLYFCLNLLFHFLREQLLNLVELILVMHDILDFIVEWYALLQGLLAAPRIMSFMNTGIVTMAILLKLAMHVSLNDSLIHPFIRIVQFFQGLFSLLLLDLLLQ